MVDRSFGGMGFGRRICDRECLHVFFRFRCRSVPVPVSDRRKGFRMARACTAAGASFTDARTSAAVTLTSICFSPRHKDSLPQWLP